MVEFARASTTRMVDSRLGDYAPVIGHVSRDGSLNLVRMFAAKQELKLNKPEWISPARPSVT